MTASGQATRSRRPSRRDFLKVSAAGAAAFTGLSLARGAHAAGKEVVKIGMIGCGGRCSGAAAESLEAGPYVKLVAMCDVFPKRAQACRERLKGQFPNQVLVDDDHCFGGFDGYKKVIEAADVVLIACASKFHPMYAEAAIQAGKHVFVEKPHGIDPVGCRRMQAACDLAKQKGLSIVSGLQSRFDTGYQETRPADPRRRDRRRSWPSRRCSSAGRTRPSPAIPSSPRPSTSSATGITSAGSPATT